MIKTEIKISIIFTICFTSILTGLILYKTTDEKIQYLFIASYFSNDSGGLGIGHGCLVIKNGFIEMTNGKKISLTEFINDEEQTKQESNGKYDYRFSLSDEKGLYC